MSTLIVAGMHRSGTSYVASLFESAGVAMGRSHPTDAFNARGYFEDVDFLALQKRMLVSACPPGERAHVDWGWNASAPLRLDALEAFSEEANALIERRCATHSLWGWKDPRSTLLLEFWSKRVADAKFVLVYREPWAVADSIRRLNAKPFRDDPALAIDVWLTYNRSLLAFYERHERQCVLGSLDTIKKDERSFLSHVEEKLGLALPFRRTLFDPRLMSEHPAPEDFATRFADAYAIWTELEERAVKPKPVLPRAPQEDCSRARPKLTVVIPCYNQGRFLPDALHSVAAAEGASHDAVIVDDGSTEPETLAMFEAVEALGWRVIHQPNRGLSQARNCGIAASRAELVLPLDADNCIAPGFIAEAIAVLEASAEVGVVYGDPDFFGLRTGRRRVGAFDLARLAVNNYIDACAVIRKEAWRAVGGFDATMRVGHEDWDFWLSVAEKGFVFHYLPKVTFRYRARADSLLSNAQRPENFARNAEHISGKHPYYSCHYPSVIGALSARYVSELNARLQAEGKLAESGEESGKLQARIAELEHHADALALSREEAERYALSLREALETLQASHAEASAYARSLERRLELTTPELAGSEEL